jgi:aminoglycoside phosphotransferase (APT) family kinase protein
MRGGRHRTFALRLFDDPRRLLEDPWYRPDAEVMALAVAGSVDAPTPELVAADTDGSEAGVPALLTTLLPGRPVRRPQDVDRFLRQTATGLAGIHAATDPGIGSLRPYSAYQPPGIAGPPTWSAQQGLWERAVDFASLPIPGSVPVFIHRDFHPGNLLWVRGRLTGVVDWTTGCRGSPGQDVAHMRWNLAESMGGDMAARLLAAYQAVTGSRVDDVPAWDIRDLVDLIPDAVEPSSPADWRHWRRIEGRLARALEAVDRGG